MGASELTTGMELDGFVIGALLHSGRMGRAFRVSAAPSRPQPPYPLLMKVPRTERGSGGEGLIAFETELSILPLLRGPHVPQFVAGGELVRTPYLVVEWIEGGTLSEALAGRAVPVEVAARYGAAVADALHSIHGQGAVHLDLKPENIILRETGEAVLIDAELHHRNVRFGKNVTQD